MKRSVLLLAFVLIIQYSFASFVIATPADSSVTSENIKVSKGSIYKLPDFSLEDYERLTNRKLNFFERLAFRLEKKHFLNQLRKTDSTSHFNIPGFLLGLLFGPFGFLAALLLSLSLKNPDIRSSALLGFGVWLAVFIILLLVLLSKGSK